LPANTLICEYAGVVCDYRDVEKSSNDSIYELTTGKIAGQEFSYVIYPKLKANLGRFISGINDKKRNKSYKPNCYSRRFFIEGKLHVLLISEKSIKPGEKLAYNYNAGKRKEVDTAKFI
jgi:hypothetical protein